MNRTMLHAGRWLVVIVTLGWSLVSRAADLLPPDRPMAEVIDHYIDAKLKQACVTPAPQAEEATLVRRLTLDLNGRIPGPGEVRAYLESTDPQKWAQLVQRLMASPWYVRHAATEFNTMLRGRYLDGPDLRRYLLVALEENRPWNQMLHEIMGGTEDPQNPEAFVLRRLKDRDVLTRDVSSIFFGINITCCQCHTHPYVDTLSQDYFFGMKAFFSRSYDFHGRLLEKQYGDRMEYKDTEGETHDVKLMFLTGTTVDVPAVDVPDLGKAIKEENKRIDELKKRFKKTKRRYGQEFPPNPSFSYRKQLVDLAGRPESQELLARSIINRLWYRFYGYGLVMLVDQMHSENPPSHPELLQWLARDLIAKNFDLRPLVQGLVSSPAYSRSSHWEQVNPPAPELFAVANLRLLTPMQFGISQRLASDPAAMAQAASLSGEEFDKQVRQWESEAQRSFGSIIEQPRDGLQISAVEALTLSNNADILKMLGGRLVSELMKIDDRGQQVDSAVWSVLTRPPTPREAELLTGYLADQSTLSAAERARIEQAAATHREAVQRAESRATEIEAELEALNDAESDLPLAQREKLDSDLKEARKLAATSVPTVPTDAELVRKACEQMVWALLTSAEFRFNH